MLLRPADFAIGARRATSDARLRHWRGCYRAHAGEPDSVHLHAAISQRLRCLRGVVVPSTNSRVEFSYRLGYDWPTRWEVVPSPPLCLTTRQTSLWIPTEYSSPYTTSAARVQASSFCTAWGARSWIGSSSLPFSPGDHHV